MVNLPHSSSCFCSRCMPNPDEPQLKLTVIKNPDGSSFTADSIECQPDGDWYINFTRRNANGDIVSTAYMSALAWLTIEEHHKQWGEKK